MAHKILNTLPSFSEEAKQDLGALGEVTYALPTQDELAAMIGEYDIAVIGLGLTFDKSLLEKAENLKVIAIPATGLDHIDREYCGEKGIEILSLKEETEFLDTITGTAELGFALMLMLMRKLPQAYNAVRTEGLWQRENFRGLSLYGKTVGIIGMGRLGKIMAAGAHGFRMPVVFSDPHVEGSAFPEYKKVELDELLTTSDVVSVHVHLMPETEHMLSTDAFKRMKNSAVLINTARGKIVDEGALINALKAGEIAGYGTDVLDGENDFAEDASAHPLVQYAQTVDNVAIVPHIGGMTNDSRVATDLFIVRKLKSHLATP